MTAQKGGLAIDQTKTNLPMNRPRPLGAACGGNIGQILVKHWSNTDNMQNDIVTFQKISTFLSNHIIIFGNVQSPADFVG